MSNTTCTEAGHCHGWAAVSCSVCGSVSPCARADCPSCGDCQFTTHEAQQRRARALVWLEDGGNVLVPDGPPWCPWLIYAAGCYGDDGFIGMAVDATTAHGAFLAWCELAGVDPTTWRDAVDIVSDNYNYARRWRWRRGRWRVVSHAEA